MCRINKGFTLIETIITAAIFSIIALAVYSTFSQGVRLWQRLTQQTPAFGVNIVLEKMSADLRNSFKFSGIDFTGRGSDISFATLIVTSNSDKQKILSLGEVGYSFDSQAGSLNRQQRNYSQIYQGKPALPRQILDNVESLSFQYYYYDSSQKVYIWGNNWQGGEEEEKGSVPLAVRIKLKFDKSTKEEGIVRTVTIPVG